MFRNKSYRCEAEDESCKGIDCGHKMWHSPCEEDIWGNGKDRKCDHKDKTVFCTSEVDYGNE